MMRWTPVNRTPDAIRRAPRVLSTIGLLLVLVLAPSGRAVSARAEQRAADQPPADIAPSALSQIAAILQEKASRSPVQQKIDSQLLYASRIARGVPAVAGVPSLQAAIEQDADSGRTIVDVTAFVSDDLLDRVRAMDVEVMSSFPEYRTMRLSLGLDQIEAIAAMPEVIFVQPKQEALLSSRVAPARLPSFEAPRRDRKRNRDLVLSQIRQVLEQGSSTNASQGPGQGSQINEAEFTHRAFAARGVFRTDGTAVKIGVLSDGVTNLALSQSFGDNPATVTVLAGQAGGGDEGTAMLELIHDVAPGAQLYFATGVTGIAQFAANIRALRDAGCAVIVDDIGYFVESVFQDGQTPAVVSTTNGGVVTEAVRDVTINSGVLYFSSAANSGNKNDNTSGTWEGDFAAGGAAGAPLPGGTYELHNFGGSTFTTITFPTGNPINLHWSDPLGAAANDYDLFVLDPTGATIVASSTNIQSGTQDPYEQTSGQAVNRRIVIAKKNASAARFLHLGTNRGIISPSTPGETHGHAASRAPGSYGVAAVDAGAASPNPFNPTNVVEDFSSDGPRRHFFNADSTAITPGNFSSGGGQLTQKPDITAADGVSITGAGAFPNPFFGTSAAAPNAAAIAALLKSANPAITQAQVRTALTTSAIDIEAPGVDRDSGAGIIMAFQALQAAGIAPGVYLAPTTVVALEDPGNANGVINVGEGARMNITLTNLGLSNVTNIAATLATSTPGITVHQPVAAAYPNINTGATGINAIPYRFTVAPNAGCPLTIDFTLAITYAGSVSPLIVPFEVITGPTGFAITTTLDATPPTGAPGVTAATGVQTGRLNRFSPATACVGTPKVNPGLNSPAGARQFDSYTFNTCAENTGSCAFAQTSVASALLTFSVAYNPTFNTADPSQNWIGDPGFSSLNGNNAPYFFSVATGAQAPVVVVHDVTPGAPSGAVYSLNVSGLCAGQCATPNQVPVAIAANRVVSAGAGGTANANINNGSFDPDGDTLTITQSPAGPYPTGVTTVLLTVTDPKGATSQATATVTVTSAPQMALSASAVNFGAVNVAGTLSPRTPAQTLILTQGGPGSVTWTATADQPWITVTPASGAGGATLTVSIVNPPAPSQLPVVGTLAGTITVNTTGAANSPTSTVNLTLLTSPQLTGPIGAFDTPVDGQANVVGSIPVTGWTIDEIGSVRVEIFRAPVAGEGSAQIFIGNGVFVNGARTDIAGLYPTKPFKDQAGWGYLLLTNFLPNQGNGTFTLYAYAVDVENNRTLLGSKTITCTNSTSTFPFGAIDTPGQGGTASGSLVNFGWALAGQPTGRFIPTDGSTIQVFVDSLPIGALDSYNNPRADIQALFPGYVNTNGAVGFKTINTVSLSNGVHTIAWLVTDNLGAASGVGSRFFTVSNSSLVAGLESALLSMMMQLADREGPGLVNAMPALAGHMASLSTIAPSAAAVGVRHGFDASGTSQLVAPDADGVRRVRTSQLERVVIDLAGASTDEAVYRGYVVDGERLRGLPIGSTLDPRTGQFAWAPPLAFGGRHTLLFVRDAGGYREQIRVDVTIDAQPTRAENARLVIDMPSEGAQLSRRFTVAGWSIDPRAADGSGIDTLHIWAYPVDGSGVGIRDGAEPKWIGEAAIGGGRDDVAALFGSRYRRSGYSAEADLAPGTYDIVVYAHSRATGDFTIARTVRVTVR